VGFKTSTNIEVKRASRSTSDAKASGSTLIATARFRLVSIAVNLAHAADTDLGGHLVGAEPRAGGEGQG